MTLRTWPALDLTLHAGLAPSDAISDELAVAIDDLEPVALEDDESGRRWRVHFARAAARDAAVRVLRDSMGESFLVQPVDLEDEGWALRVQEDLRAVRVGCVVVAPPWDLPASDPREPDSPVVVVIEPSMGFGTGHHQSTRLCLEALQAQPLAAASLIDVGTGSGVLALAAHRLGARPVVALDNDPDSITAALDNADRNGLTGRLDIQLASVAEFRGGPSDVVVANLTAWLLRQASEAIAGLVTPGGRLVVSGFTTDQVPLVVETFAGLDSIGRFEEEDWVCLVFSKARRSF